MSEYKDNEIRQRFVKVYERLIIDKKVKNTNQFAIGVGTTHSVISLIIQGKRKASITMIELLVNKYNIDANYLFGQSQSIYRGFHDSMSVNLN